MHLHCAEVVQALDAGTVDAAVSDQCAGTRQADLAAMGVAGQGKLVAVGSELLKYARFGGVEQCQCQVRIRVGGAGDLRIIIKVVVRIIYASDGELDVAHLEFHASLVGVVPATLDECRTHALPRQVNVGRLTLAAQQVLEWVDWTRRPIVVGAEDEQAWSVQQRAEGAQRIGHAALVRQVVAGVDHQIGIQFIQRRNPLNFCFLPRNHVQIRDMKDAELFLTAQSARRQQRQRVLFQLKLGQFGVTPRQGAKASGGNAAHNRENLHLIKPTWRRLKYMSQLKETIRGDLKTAMKAREKERTSAIRALLAAIQAEETNGARHELTDEDVLKVIAREIKKRRESAEVYAENGRQELADAELADVPYFEAYQPEQLDDAELDTLVGEAIAEVEAETGETVTIKQMGNVMKVATAKAAGRADGKRLSAAVKAKLS